MPRLRHVALLPPEVLLLGMGIWLVLAGHAAVGIALVVSLILAYGTAGMGALYMKRRLAKRRTKRS